MSFKTDGGGVAISLPDCKISVSAGASTWNTRLSQIARSRKRIDVCTYSLPHTEYIKNILDKRSDDVHIIAHEKFRDRAEALQKLYPKLPGIVLCPDVHAKMVLIEPFTVWLSSANFGSSGWFEHTIGIHSEEAYLFYRRALDAYRNGR